VSRPVCPGGPMTANEDAARGVMVDVGDGPELFYALCWEQVPGEFTACDRMKHHQGPHSWAPHD
jgi:hypothetical protein